MYSKSIVVKSDHQGLLCNFLVSTVLAESQAAFGAMTSADKVMTKQMFCIHTPMLKVLTAIWARNGHFSRMFSYNTI